MKMNAENGNQPLAGWKTLLLALGAVAAFHLAYSFRSCSFLIVLFLYCLFELSKARTGRQAFYLGLGVGLLAYGPQLNFFWNIFGAAAIALWVVLAFWLALFLALGRMCRLRLRPWQAALVIPFLWTGLEYFRSELYYLRFSWLNIGYAFSDSLSWLPIRFLGMYGIGFGLMAAVTMLSLIPPRKRLVLGTAFLAALGLLANLRETASPSLATPAGNLKIAGVQLEFPSELDVVQCLDRLVKEHPEAQLLVLSEYTFNGPLPEGIKSWCRQHERHLIVGATEPAGTQFYNTAFVVGPDGNILFRQAKSVPIQFFKDGLPARGQKLWESPWGRIGICICYDLSYRRVTDRLVELGAQALVAPTMDVADWGRHQHELHARVAPVRAAEYGIPIFRLASSGISQCVCATGETMATAPFPGEGAVLAGTLALGPAGGVPWDRWLAPFAAGVAGLVLAGMIGITFYQKRANDRQT